MVSQKNETSQTKVDDLKGADKSNWWELEFGDIIKISFSPAKGHEQKGYRPGLVISDPASQRELGGLTTVVPISNTQKEFFTRIRLDAGEENAEDDEMKTSGSILMDQVKVMDLGERTFTYVEKAPDQVLETCKEIFTAIYEKFLAI